jgi:5-methyltetrahydrofolate--homocysteine methyltransferase
MEVTMNKFQTLLANSRALLADGAMGTMLFEAGLESGESPQAWNVSHPEHVRAVHRAYLDAGSQIVLSNTFGGNRYRLARHNLQAQLAELNRAGAALLRAEVDEAGGSALAAGDMGPTGELLAPLGKLAYADAVDAYAEQAAALLAGGVDLIWVETMSALEEVHAAIEGVRRVSADVPVIMTMTFEKHGRTMMGVTPQQAMKSATEWGASAMGGNCGTGPEELLAMIRTLHGLAPDMTLVFKPNAGVPELIDGKTTYNATAASMAPCAIAAIREGARIIGACCGSTPGHIRAMREAISDSAGRTV